MNDTKKTVRIQLDSLQGPIWISDIETGEPLTGIELIDHDPVLRELNRQASRVGCLTTVLVKNYIYYSQSPENETLWFIFRGPSICESRTI